jgi:hypothetical protein
VPFPNVARAYQQLANLEKLPGCDSKSDEGMRKARSAMTGNTVCRFDIAHSLRESYGAWSREKLTRCLTGALASTAGGIAKACRTSSTTTIR